MYDSGPVFVVFIQFSIVADCSVCTNFRAEGLEIIYPVYYQ